MNTHKNIYGRDSGEQKINKIKWSLWFSRAALASSDLGYEVAEKGRGWKTFNDCITQRGSSDINWMVALYISKESGKE